MSDIPYVQFEAKKGGLSQNQDGLWNMRLNVAQDQMPPDFLTAPMGQRLTVIVVALRGDGEDAKPGEIFGETGYTKGSGPKTTPKDTPKSEGARAVQRAAILCDDPQFAAWVGSEFPKWLGHPTAAFMRDYCGVQSRRDLATEPDAMDKFLSLETIYRYRNSRR